MMTEIKLEIQAQPDDVSCGPTCLYAIYKYYGVEDVTLKQLLTEIHRLDHGGTLAEFLACHALKRDFQATIYTYHLQMFDPTWFAADGRAHDPEDLASRLDQQLKAKGGDRRLKASTRAFKEFLKLGGELKMQDLTPALIRSYLVQGVPILAGLSSTFLYRAQREMDETNADDDIQGSPQGHFVMLVGYDSTTREVLVADPLDHNPPFHTAKYRLDIDRLVNAILLGILTYDANLLIIKPKPPAQRHEGESREREAPSPRRARRRRKQGGE
ncbi:MAG: C39 family peptidase [Planctomycetota bacterium]|nr:C39 family peptidase [Planctomycetota bacterium]